MIHPDTLAALGSQHFTWVVLARFEFDSDVIAFSNLFEPVDFEGEEYMPFGNLGDITPLTHTTALNPQWVDVSLSGIRAEVLEAALNENYFNRRVFIHLACLGDDGGFIGEPFLYFAGRIDSMDCYYGETCEIVVKCSDEISDWERPKIERYTDQDQRARYPGDTGFRFVAQVSTREIVWPNRQWFINRA